jgi:hypothetical protein
MKKYEREVLDRPTKEREVSQLLVSQDSIAESDLLLETQVDLPVSS